MRSTRTEHGTGLTSTAFGAAAFLGFLVLATQVLLSLYANSVVRSVAWDTARSIAQSRDLEAQRFAERQATTRLAGFRNVHIVTEGDSTAVRVHITADRSAFAPRFLHERTSIAQIDETATARIEAWQ